MAIRIPMTAERLGHSRFAITPSVEVVGTLIKRADRAPAPHLRRRIDRFAAVDPMSRALLEGLCPVTHPYTPDFLTPAPQGADDSIADLAAQIEQTPAEIIEYHLDLGFRGRPIPPDTSHAFGGDRALEAWRREMPQPVRDALADGPTGLARRAAAAVVDWFEAVLEPEWLEVHEVMSDDIAHRARQMAERGSLALVEDLGQPIMWQDDEVRIEGRYDLVVDWEVPGLLLLPSTTAHRVRFAVEAPDPPVLIYPVRGVAALWGDSSPAPNHTRRGRPEITELIGDTRTRLLELLDRPRTTAQLSRLLSLSPPTISYHLGILHRAGLLRRTRHGRVVEYSRTPS
ncbi:ArsR/SmtB family transcription factor [Propionibacteriaceae bacterium Y1700]|uniref:ArsR/SmtB family transcription factor n=1 Tax=Microlunatus sp. Y1700 TaxID=3418487 RepID=UPI003DA748E3